MLTMNHEEIIKLYYNCFAQKNRNKLTEILSDDFNFISQYARYTDKESMLNEIWPQVLVNENVISELKVFKADSQFIVRYILVSKIKQSMCEFIQFKNDEISSIEVFIGNEY